MQRHNFEQLYPSAFLIGQWLCRQPISIAHSSLAMFWHFNGKWNRKQVCWKANWLQLQANPMVNLTEMKSKPDIALSGDRTEASEQESKCEASKTVPDFGNRIENAVAFKNHGRRTKLRWSVLSVLRVKIAALAWKLKESWKKLAMALKPSWWHEVPPLFNKLNALTRLGFVNYILIWLDLHDCFSFFFFNRKKTKVNTFF